MKAISIFPGQAGSHIIDKQEPSIKSPHDVKVKILEVGICGTDREQVSGGHAKAPEGKDRLVIGHEMFGQVVETGEEVTKVKPGDYGVFVVRRECNLGLPCCTNNRSDMCFTGQYTERGIKLVDGFETEYVVDQEKYLVKVPDDIKDIGVLAEPMSVASKAIEEAAIIQAARLPQVKAQEWYQDKTVLVAGIGAIGLLAAFALKLRGAKIWGLDIVEKDSLRVKILDQLGGKYIDGRSVDIMDIDDQCGEVDYIFEATGVAKLSFQLIDVLGINGIYVMTGIPGDSRPTCIMGAELMKQMVLKNQVIMGSVNASIDHFDVAVRDLEESKKQWGSLINQLITARVTYDKFQDAIDLRSENDIKTVVEWGRRP
jgi:glucose 1-dehydrogenase